MIGNFFYFQPFEWGLSRWWDMHHFDYPWFTHVVLIAIALLATVNALTSQTIFGKTLATVLVGPALAAVGDIHFLRVEGRASRNLK
jgi:hypothetical protein